MSFNDNPNFYYRGDDLPDLNGILRVDGYSLIDEKLEAVASAATTPPVWLEAWRRSTRGRTGLRYPEGEAGPEERLAVWKAVRDSGDLPEDASFYLVADEVDVLTQIQVRLALEEIERLVDGVWDEHGFGEWRSQSAREWTRYDEFPGRCPEHWDRLYAEALEARGEGEAARIYRTDRWRFEERMRDGKAFFHPPPRPAPQPARPVARVPSWGNEFHGVLSDAGLFEAVDTTRVRLDHRWGRDERLWEVRIALPPVEWVGGPKDGRVEPMSSRVDLRRLRGVFDQVREFTWNPNTVCDWNSPNVRVRGVWRGHPIVVRVSDLPFVDAAPVKINASDGSVADA